LERLNLSLRNIKTHQTAQIIEIPSVGLIPSNDFRLLALQRHGLIYESDIACSDVGVDDENLLIHFIEQLTQNGENFDDWTII